jgi:kinesin family protein 2/24
LIKNSLEIHVSFFEIYAGRCLDLLNDKNVLNIMEDKNNNIQIQGLMEKSASTSK